MAEYRTFAEMMAQARDVKAVESRDDAAVEGNLKGEMAYWQTVADSMGLAIHMDLKQDHERQRLPPQQWSAHLIFALPAERVTDQVQLIELQLTPRFRAEKLGNQPITVPDAVHPVALFMRRSGSNNWGDSVSDKERVLRDLQFYMRQQVTRLVGLRNMLQ
jgi:hypothetical protein